MHATGVVFVRHGRSLLAVLLLTTMLTLGLAPDATAEPAGDVIIAWHATLASSWLDPATAPPQITPFAVLYALHDTLIRPLPGQRIGASLAESWKESPDGLVYDRVVLTRRWLRRGRGGRTRCGCGRRRRSGTGG